MPRNQEVSPDTRSSHDAAPEVSASGGSTAEALDIARREFLERQKQDNRKYDRSVGGRQTRRDYRQSEQGKQHLQEAKDRFLQTAQGEAYKETHKKISRYDRLAERYQQKDLSGKKQDLRGDRPFPEQLVARAQANERGEQGVLWLEGGRYRPIEEEQASLQQVGELGIPEHLREQYQRQLSEVSASPETSSGESE